MAMRRQATLTYSLFLSPILEAFQQNPNSPSCLTLPSGPGLESKMVLRMLRMYVQVTINRRITLTRLENSKMADCHIQKRRGVNERVRKGMENAVVRQHHGSFL